MNFLYKTLTYPDNPDAEYQRRKGVWYKRKKNSKGEWYLVTKDKVGIIERYFENRKPLYFYNDKLLITSVALLGLTYFIYLKRGGFGTKKK
jgi:hypothetical protein